MLSVHNVAKNGLTASKINDDLAWAVGAIQPLDTDVDDNLLQAVLASLAKVDDAQLPYSACTDGRLPVRLLNGDPVPIREQMVGADMVSAFYVAETVGSRFYKDPDAPVAERVREVAEFLKENGITPSTHIGCGAAAGFVTITENAVTFSKDARFVARQKELLPEGVYDEALHAQMLAGNQERVKKGAYEGLSADVFVQVVEAVSGKQAIAELKDDGRGVHGHVEEAIVRIRVPNVAIDEAKLARLTNGREVFGVNDTRMQAIARLFSRGNDTDYRMAMMALEGFADCGHGTLARNLPTYIVTPGLGRG